MASLFFDGTFPFKNLSTSNLSVKKSIHGTDVVVVVDTKM